MKTQYQRFAVLFLGTSEKNGIYPMRKFRNNSIFFLNFLETENPLNEKMLFDYYNEFYLWNNNVVRV